MPPVAYTLKQARDMPNPIFVHWWNQEDERWYSESGTKEQLIEIATRLEAERRFWYVYPSQKENVK